MGGNFDNPFLVVIAACETVSHSSEALDEFFSIGSAAARATLDQGMMQAIASLLRAKERL